MSFGILVARFGDLLDGQAPAAPDDARPAATFPDVLAHLREELNHHVIPLLVLARSDADYAATEREAIMSYCLSCLGDDGVAATAEEQEALAGYLRDFRPIKAQLAPALRRLENEPKDRIVRLVAAARAVVEADGERRPHEMRILDEIARDLEAL